MSTRFSIYKMERSAKINGDAPLLRFQEILLPQALQMCQRNVLRKRIQEINSKSRELSKRTEPNTVLIDLRLSNEPAPTRLEAIQEALWRPLREVLCRVKLHHRRLRRAIWISNTILRRKVCNRSKSTVFKSS